MILAIRHGATEGNERDVHKGIMDFPLSQKGRDAARDAGYALRKMRFDTIRASPLQRARETAQTIAQTTGAQVETDPRLLPIDMGLVQGKDKDGDGVPELVGRHAKYRDEPFPGGESVHDMVRRMLPAALPELDDQAIHPWVTHSKDINTLIAVAERHPTFAKVLDECPVEPGNAGLFTSRGWQRIPLVEKDNTT